MRTVVAGLLAAGAMFAAPPVEAQRQQAAPAPPPALSAEAEAALQELEPRFAGEVALGQGWYRDRAVQYYDFGPIPVGAQPARALWPIHGFDAKGNPVAIRGQYPIFSTLPALPGYSGVFRLAYVVTADFAQPNQLRDMASVDAMVRSGKATIRETDSLYNLPIVPRGTKLARDSTPAMKGWYEGREIQFFDFGPASLVPSPMWRFARGQDATGQPVVLEQQNSVVDSIPMAAGYPDVWEISYVNVDPSYVPNTFKNAGAIRGAQLSLLPGTTVRNLPIVFVDDAPLQRVASPVRQFADLRSPFPPAPTVP